MLEKDSVYLVEDIEAEDSVAFVQDKKTCCCFSKMARTCTIVFLVLLSVTLFACLVVANPPRFIKVVVTPDDEPESQTPVNDKLSLSAYSVENKPGKDKDELVQFHLEENDKPVIGSSYLNMEEPSPIMPSIVYRFAKDLESLKLTAEQQKATEEEPAQTDSGVQDDKNEQSAVTDVTIVNHHEVQTPSTATPIAEPKTEDVPKEADQIAVSSVNVVKDNKDNTTGAPEITTTTSSPTTTETPTVADNQQAYNSAIFTKLFSLIPLPNYHKSSYMYPHHQMQSNGYYYPMYQPHTSFPYFSHLFPNFQQFHVPQHQVGLPLPSLGQRAYHLPLPLTSLVSSILRDIHTSEPWPTQVHIRDLEIKTPESQEGQTQEAQTPETQASEVQTQDLPSPGIQTQEVQSQVVRSPDEKPTSPLKLNLNVAGPAGFKARFSSGMDEEGISGRARITWG